MSEENNKPSNDDQMPLAEVLIQTAIKATSEQPMMLGELIGHFEVAKMNLYGRVITQASQASSPPAGPVGDAGTEGTAGASQDAVEDKA